MKLLLTTSIFLLGSFLFAQQTLENKDIGGVNREYYQYLPTGFNSATESLPLVICLHGLGGTSLQMTNIGFNQIGDTARFITVYPQGLMNALSQTSWNNGLPFVGATSDDIGLFYSIIDDLVQNSNVDESRIYFTGFSMGSIMSYHMACELNHRITAIGCMAGTMSSADVTNCNPTYKTPVIHLHGTADATVPYDTAPITGLSLVPETMNFWNSQHGCSPTADSTRIPDTAADGLTVDRFVYNNCTPANSLELWRINGADHIYLYQPVNDFTESVEIWRFFSQWSKPATASVKEDYNTSFEVQPNPSNGNITIISTNKTSYSIFSISGKLISNGELQIGSNKIDLTTLRKGVYFLKGENYNGQSERIIID